MVQTDSKVVVNPRFQIGQRIFHAAPESEAGIIIDWAYTRSTDMVYYTVALGFNSEIVCREIELSAEKVF